MEVEGFYSESNNKCNHRLRIITPDVIPVFLEFRDTASVVDSIDNLNQSRCQKRRGKPLLDAIELHLPRFATDTTKSHSDNCISFSVVNDIRQTFQTKASHSPIFSTCGDTRDVLFSLNVHFNGKCKSRRFW